MALIPEVSQKWTDLIRGAFEEFLEAYPLLNTVFYYWNFQNFPVQITGIQSTGQRIIVTDSQESVHFVRYRKGENQLVIFCDDTTPRYVTTCCVLDYNTVAVGDKFGSISIISLALCITWCLAVSNFDTFPALGEPGCRRSGHSELENSGQGLPISVLNEEVLSVQLSNPVQQSY
ncbi:unnamed protein product [Haemonchus placei]|uniref:CPSF_A domain-containing protein n=1 Tax=Haemonchus placei TaxID=6290 RepID=A0A158QKB5_HAEPC|nr:unnamed protein product [Haemonchus placei]